MYSVIEHNTYYGTIENMHLHLFNTEEQAKKYALKQAQELINTWARLRNEDLHIEEHFSSIYVRSTERTIFAKFIIIDTINEFEN